MKNFFLGCSMLALSVPLAFGNPAQANPVSSFELKQSVSSSAVILVADKDKTLIGAQNFIDSMGKRAIEFLENGQLSQDEKTRKFKRLLEDSFDMKTIGRFSLGRYWKVATPAQQKEYLSLFEEMVVDVYTQRFDDYAGQAFDVRSAKRQSERDFIVTSYILSKNSPEVQIDWRVRYKNNRYKVVDVIVEGVSMSVTQRSDFSSVIQRGGGNIDSLLTHLRKS